MIKEYEEFAYRYFAYADTYRINGRETDAERCERTGIKWLARAFGIL